jgi:hypothetical protein
MISTQPAGHAEVVQKAYRFRAASILLLLLCLTEHMPWLPRNKDSSSADAQMTSANCGAAQHTAEHMSLLR